METNNNRCDPHLLCFAFLKRAYRVLLERLAICTAHKPAVSVRSRQRPSETGIKPFATAYSTSSIAKSPSGPMSTVTGSFGFRACSSLKRSFRSTSS